MNRFDWLLVFGAGLLLAGLLGWADFALAFPENVRKGATCAACHVSPSGGGALTNYGRSTSEELATFGPEGSGRLLGVVPLPDWFAVGGDARYVSLGVPEADFYRSFVMQRDLELAVRLDTLWVAASVGQYGEDLKTESRRAYVAWTPAKGVTLRAGKYFPTFGLMVPDHTVTTRRGVGWDQGTESYNAELMLRSDVGELSMAYVAGEKDLMSGTTTRATLYLGEYAQVGTSAWYGATPETSWLVYGAHALAWYEPFYVMGEAYRRYDDTTATDTAYAKAGAEIYRGVHTYATYEVGGPQERWGAGLTWFPLPHLETTVEGKYSADGTYSYTALMHWWP